jgi:type IX secretion system PorP/SprF family membrane protein
MIMKAITLTIILLYGCLNAVAQQKPHFTQYVLNNYILNPALSGIENYTDLKVGARDQWVGMNGAPRTVYLSIHGPIGKKDYKTNATSFSVPGENPRGTSYWENYTASEPHHGVGFAMMNDQTGNYSNFSANVSYAYHLGISPRTNLAVGFAGGIAKVSYNRSKATPIDPNDPALGNGSADLFKIRPDLNAGIWLYGADFFAGISARQIIPQKVAFVNDTLGISLVPHLFATTGYRFLLNDDLNLIPSVMVKYVSPLDPQVDLNAKLQYRDLLWIGASVRFKDGYAAMLGLNVGNTFNIGYAYDYTQTPINTASKGSHEIILGFLINNKYSDACPRNIW